MFKCLFVPPQNSRAHPRYKQVRSIPSSLCLTVRQPSTSCSPLDYGSQRPNVPQRGLRGFHGTEPRRPHPIQLDRRRLKSPLRSNLAVASFRSRKISVTTASTRVRDLRQPAIWPLAVRGAAEAVTRCIFQHHGTAGV